LINDLGMVDHRFKQVVPASHRARSAMSFTLTGGTVAKALAKGSRITGAQRGTLSAQYAKRYSAGESIRKIAEDAGRSFGFVHGVLKEAGVQLRGRGGATRGAKKSTSNARKKAAVAPAKKASATKSAAKKTPAKVAAKKVTTKAPAKKAPAKVTTKKVAKAPAKKTPTKAAAKKAPAKTAAKKSPAKTAAKKSPAAKKVAAKKR
jgi:helix-turn-helix protein